MQNTWIPNTWSQEMPRKSVPDVRTHPNLRRPALGRLPAQPARKDEHQDSRGNAPSTGTRSRAVPLSNLGPCSSVPSLPAIAASLCLRSRTASCLARGIAHRTKAWSADQYLAEFPTSVISDFPLEVRTSNPGRFNQAHADRSSWGQAVVIRPARLTSCAERRHEAPTPLGGSAYLSCQQG